MSKMNELDVCIGEIKAAADTLYSVAETLTRLFSSPDEPEAPAPVTKEQVRSVLSQKSTAGHSAAVRVLLKNFGASQLSDVDPGKYADLINAAAAVARIYKPGIKFDCVPVLDGDQGIGKSSIFKDLVTPEYYSESLSLTDMDDKSGAEKLQGFWIVEIGELAGMKKADIEKVKAFLSTADDKYRPSYGKTVESHPRQCIIIATVNGERGYLRDITGNRRFWIIKLHQKKQKKKWSFDQHFRDQFWAEAKAIYESGEKLYLEGDLLEASEQAQRSAMEVDERIGMVEEYLNTLLPENWNDMDIFARRNYMSDKGDPTNPKGTVVRTEVTNAEIWCECFGRNLPEMKPADSYATAALMSQVDGWERTTERSRQPLYGRQRVYRRVD